MNQSVKTCIAALLSAILVANAAGRAIGARYPAYIDGMFTMGDAQAEAPYDLADTFNLSSRPSATKTIFLDFNGHHSVNNSWGHDIDFPAFDLDGDTSTFSSGERIEIQKIWQNVAEDYLPFNVNVTTWNPGVTALRKLGTGDVNWGVRVVMTQPTDGFGEGIGGHSGSVRFDDDADNPVFCFNKGNRKAGMTATHEVGHTFGLSHDGLYDLEYHPGTGGYGGTSWGPLMGAPFDATLSQWSNGDYDGSTNTADDYAYITSYGFGYRTDDYLTSVSDPYVLDVEDNSAWDWGIIEDRYDVDHFQFTTAPGQVSIHVNPFNQDANLDVKMTLYDSSGTVVQVIDPTVIIHAFLDIELEAGSYVIAVDGDGYDGRYSDYGSVGFYELSVDLPLFADLNEDDQLDGLDWQIFIDHLETDLSGLSPNEAYFLGDLNLDGESNIADFGLFKDEYISTNGQAAFEALFSAVPEPTSLVLLFTAVVGWLWRDRTLLGKQPLN